MRLPIWARPELGVWGKDPRPGEKRGRSFEGLNDLLGDGDGNPSRPTTRSWYDQVSDAMDRAPTSKLARRAGRQAIAERPEIGPRPDGCSVEVWKELGIIHYGLAHPTSTAMVRMLARHGVLPEVLEFARLMRCPICIELSKPGSKNAAAPSALETLFFRDVVAVDEFFVVLTDGYQVCLVMILDHTSRLAVTCPILRVTTNVTAEELQESVERQWLPWAGAMKKLRGDPDGNSRTAIGSWRSSAA